MPSRCGCVTTAPKRSSNRRPGPPWWPLAQPLETISKHAISQAAPEVGVDAAGDATVVWEEDVGPEQAVVTSSRTASGKWSAPVPLSPIPGGASSIDPRLAENAAGDVVAIWETFYSQEIIEAVTRAGPSGTWSKPVMLSK